MIFLAVHVAGHYDKRIPLNSEQYIKWSYSDSFFPHNDDLLSLLKVKNMLQSMTGFGKSTASFFDKKVVVEIRSLNSKNLDVYLKVPSLYKSKEIEIRKLIGNQLDRGKIEAIVTIENTSKSDAYAVNKALATKYLNELKELSAHEIKDDSTLLATVVRLPDVLISKEEQVSEDEWISLKKTVEEALDHLVDFRKQEGAALKKDFELNISRIGNLLKEVPQYEQERIDTIRERMHKSLEELSEKVDENRFEQELIFYIEKLDVSEEKVRLENHLSYFKETLNQTGPVGKKLGFITQEIGREINTLGSKANHSELQKIVVNMKDCLEKIKEQVLNTL